MQRLSINLTDFKQFYFPGEVINGYVRFDCSDRIMLVDLDLQFVGRGVTRKYLAFSSFDREKSYVNHRSSFLDRTAEGRPNPFWVDAGTYKHHFRIRIPTDCPPSVEAKYGWIHYWLKTRLHMPYLFIINRKRKVLIMQNIDHYSVPPTICPVSVEDEANFERCLFLLGEVGCRLTCEKNYFSIMESFRPHIQIWNRTSKNVSLAILKLKQVNVYYGQPGDKCENIIDAENSWYKKERNEDTLWQKSGLKAGPLEFQINCTLPMLPPSNLQHCNLMDIFYKLHLKVHVECQSVQVEQQVEIVADQNFQLSSDDPDPTAERDVGGIGAQPLVFEPRHRPVDVVLDMPAVERRRYSPPPPYSSFEPPAYSLLVPPNHVSVQSIPHSQPILPRDPNQPVPPRSTLVPTSDSNQPILPSCTLVPPSDSYPPISAGCTLAPPLPLRPDSTRSLDSEESTIPKEVIGSIPLTPGDSNPPVLNPVGPPGDSIPVGPPGDSIPVGPPGDSIPVGPPGDSIPVGPPGDSIPVGPPGDSIPVGPPGDSIPVGPPGDSIPVGPPGDSIPVGPPGDSIPVGPPGDSIPVGPPGDSIPVGPPGDSIPVGPPGDSDSQDPLQSSRL